MLAQPARFFDVNQLVGILLEAPDAGDRRRAEQDLVETCAAWLVVVDEDRARGVVVSTKQPTPALPLLPLAARRTVVPPQPHTRRRFFINLDTLSKPKRNADSRS